MILRLDCSLRDLLVQALEYHSTHYILHTLGEIERVNADEFADAANRLLLKATGEDIE